MAPTEFLSGLMAVVLLDLVLAGDNAIVIALAARNLPGTLQRRAVLWGTVGAVAVRIALSAVVIWLLRLPGLMLLGGVLLLPIAWKLLRQDDSPHEVSAAAGFWSALRTIVVADTLMGVDNVLAIAGASHGNLPLLACGLLISVPLVVWGSTLILKLVGRFPAIIYLGAAAIAWTAGRMVSHDHLLHGWFAAHPRTSHLLEIALAALVCGGSWLARRRQAADS
ncbi:TerC family protein [Rhodanobacter sp. DHB23]|uniref:TerC family protein n=1 Tax=Rhodanobacter sp. DHB23 TaxID=2775923 RepID=UPI00177EFB8A|nr:TerC family protein [Rhodanobacter sp. DHB23]MBD8872578.1 TerC family protein [Rhodanobacter sp. DHB23]